MAGFARLLILAFVLLTVVYFALFYYLRTGRKERMEAEWDGESDMREALTAYEGRLRRNLVLGVYILPLVVMVATIYFTNFA